MSLYQDKISRKARARGLNVISYQHFNACKQALAELRDVHLAHTSLDAEALLLTGPSGSGKTTVLKEFENEHRKKFGQANPILRFRLPADCTPKQLAAAFAAALDDPLVANSTLAQLTLRIPRIAKSKGISMVAIDEGQHLFSRTKQIRNDDAADTIKVLMDEIQVPFVLVGMPELRKIVDAGEQLSRRTGRRLELAGFDLADPDEFATYIEILREMDRALPFSRASHLSDKSLATAIHVDTGGVIGRIKRLVTLAAELAIDRNDPCVDVRHLAAAREELASDAEVAVENPFARLVGKLAA